MLLTHVLSPALVYVASVALEPRSGYTLPASLSQNTDVWPCGVMVAIGGKFRLAPRLASAAPKQRPPEHPSKAELADVTTRNLP